MKLILSCLMALLSVMPVHSQEAAAAAPAGRIDSGDTAWMLTSTALVLLMTIPGLALFYGGMVRRMNVLATCMQSFAICCLVAVLWVIVGYSLAFTNGGSFSAYVGGLGRVMFAGADMNAPFTLGAGTSGPSAMTIPESVYMMFQMTFAIITPALITGAFAERIKFSALMLFTAAWSLLVYAPIAHAVWHPNGFLAQAGVLDFAGGTVVHINAGVAGLVAVLVIGKRRGYGRDHIVPHNLVLSLIGASLLWVGWFGFNAGSAGAANGRAGMAMATTMLGSASAGLAWMFVEWGLKKKPSVLGVISGAVAGLVAITPASGYVDLSGALAIGIAAGVICYYSATSLKRALGYDDSLDAFGVHGIGGIVGALLTGVFARSAIGGDTAKGWIDGNPHQILVQAEAVGFTIVYCAVVSFVLLKLTDFVVGLRVSEEAEHGGLDSYCHGGKRAVGMIPTLLPFTAFAIAASATPGPNNVMVMAEGATYGLRATVPHILGISIGFGLMVAIIGTGLAGPLATYKPLHDILRWIGIAWMIVLAWKITRSTGPDNAGTRAAKPPMGFIGACGFQWINPKAWLMAVATAATYTTNDGDLFTQVGILSVIFVLVCIPCAGGWAALGAGAGRLLATPRRLKVFNVSMAGLLLLSVIPMFWE